ncbi:MAG: adenylate/guanylate cyclase domain-containing protein [Spirochaetia bacterium]|jgi:adenylate cyclase
MSGRRILQGVIIGAAAAALSAALWLPGALELFEVKTWDLRARLLAPQGAAAARVVEVLVNQKDLNWAKDVNGWPWPWPRTAYAAVASFCKRAGARALVFDLIFSEPSAFGIDDDETFAKGITDNGRVVGIFSLGSNKDEGSATVWPGDVPAPALSIAGLPDWARKEKPKTLAFTNAQFPIPELSRSARMLASPKLFPDPVDSVYRREPLFNMFDGRVVPSEALAAWIVGNGGSGTIGIRPGVLTIGRVSVPIDSEGSAVIRYRPLRPDSMYSAAAVIQSEIQLMNGEAPGLDPSVFKDAYVLFGVAAAGLYDLKPTPLSGLTPAVHINAAMLDNLLSGGFMGNVPFLPTILLLLALCIGAGISVSSVSGAGRSALIYILFLPLAPGLGIAAYALGWWLQMVALELGVVFSLVGSSLASYATEGQQKRYIKGAFKQYLSPAVIEELIAHPERLTLGGERRELTIFFSDVQGFTGISEALTPEALTALLNEYLSAMTDIIQEEGGTIDKFEGDAIIAFWNAPLAQEDHAVRGVRAALRCQAKLAEMRPGFRGRIGKDMLMRVGLNSGPAVVGNMGSKTRFDYTMLGDQVNLASRLEGINKQFQTFTMISEAVVQKIAGAFPVRELSRVAVVGRKEPVTVFEPMLPEDYAARMPALEIFDKGLREYYAGRFLEAERIFTSAASSDPASEAYARKCRELAASPPEGGWNGVWVMTEK